MGAALPPELAAVAGMALRADPAARYRSAGQFQEDIERWLEGRPVIARPDTMRYRARKFVQRNRLAVAAAALFGLLVIGFAATTGVQARRLAAERDRARSERAQAEQVMDLLVDLFRTGDPRVEPGGDTLRVAALLERSERAIVALDAEPQVQARLGEVLASIHEARSRFDRARPLFEAALAIQEALAGADSPDALRLRRQLALLTSREQGARAAEPLLRESLARHRRVFGEEHADVATAMQDLAATLKDRNESRRLLEGALAMRRRLLAPGDPSIASSLNALAMWTLDGGDLEGAGRLFAEALGILRAHLPAAHPHVLVLMHNLAAIQARQGHWAEAEAVQREVLALRRRVEGPGTLGCASSLESLGASLVHLGAHEEALEVFREAKSIFELLLKPGHWRIANAQRNTALALILLGREAEGLALLDEAVASLRESGSDVSTEIAFYRAQGVPALLALGRVDEALARAEAALAAVDSVAMPGGNRDVARLYLGTALLAKGRPAKAEPLFREALRLRESLLPPEHPGRDEALCALGRALAAQGRWTEAAAAFAAGWPAYRSWGHVHGPEREAVRADWARTLAALGRGEEAADILGDASADRP